MNRTTTFLVIAAALGLVALVVKLPSANEAKPPPVPVQPVALPQPPQPPPTQMAPVAPSTPGSLTLTGKLSHPYVTPGMSDVFLSFDVTGVEVPGSNDLSGGENQKMIPKIWNYTATSVAQTAATVQFFPTSAFTFVTAGGSTNDTVPS